MKIMTLIESPLVILSFEPMLCCKSLEEDKVVVHD